MFLQELWNIFTFYTLHGNPLDPGHLRVSSRPIMFFSQTSLFDLKCLSSPPNIISHISYFTTNHYLDFAFLNYMIVHELIRHYCFPPQSSQFIKLVRDCQIVGANATEADPPLVEADVQVRNHYLQISPSRALFAMSISWDYYN